MHSLRENWTIQASQHIAELIAIAHFKYYLHIYICKNMFIFYYKHILTFIYIERVHYATA